MESSTQFAEIIFNLFFCMVVITYSGFNIDYYNKIKEKPSQAITTSEAESMFYVSIALIVITSFIFAYYIYRIFTYTESNKSLFVKQSPSMERTTLDRYNLMSNRNQQFFNPQTQSFRGLKNINQSYQEPPLYTQRPPVIGTGF